MNTRSAQQDQWDLCASGELHRMVGRIKARQRRQFLRRVAGVVAGAGTVWAGVYLTGWWLTRPIEYNYGGIACSEVKRLISDYRAGRLDPGLTQRISIHLQKCPNCGPAYRRMTA